MTGSTKPQEIYLARTGQQLSVHLITVSEGAGAICNKIGLRLIGELSGLLHDIGKYSVFQDYLRDMRQKQETLSAHEYEAYRVAKRGTVDHSTAGAQKIWQVLGPRGGKEKLAAQILAIVIASHHSGLVDCLDLEGKNYFERRINKNEEDTDHGDFVVRGAHTVQALQRADSVILERMERLFQDPALTTNLGEMLDRIKNGEGPYRNIYMFKIGMLLRFLFSALIDADRTDTGNHERPARERMRQFSVDFTSGRPEIWTGYTDFSKLIGRLDEKLTEYAHATSPINLLRRQVSENCWKAATGPKGIRTLTAPTGSAKTLGALRFALHHAKAHGLDRIVYVAPFTSIVDQTAEEFRNILEVRGTQLHSVVLEHHSNLSHRTRKGDEEISGDADIDSEDRHRTLTENWDAPVICTTAVQFLNTCFGEGTVSVRRMHQLAKAVIIFDEIQTLPIHCIHIFNNAVNFLVEHCGSSVLLTTATQPTLDKVNPEKGALRLLPNPEIAHDMSAKFSTLAGRHSVKYIRKAKRWEVRDVAQLAVSAAKENGSCLVVLNTRPQSLAVFGACKAEQVQQDFFAHTFHFNTLMCPVHRMHVLRTVKQLLAKNEPVIFVSTQAIEAGIDISFGSAIRSLAGLDSIIQAAGRCNRHSERPPAPFYILNMKDENLESLEEIRMGQVDTERVISEMNKEIDLTRVEYIQDYFGYKYEHFKSQMVGYLKPNKPEHLLDMLGENSNAVGEYNRIREDPQERYNKDLLAQSFSSAAKAFEVITQNERGVIVPYICPPCEKCVSGVDSRYGCTTCGRPALSGQELIERLRRAGEQEDKTYRWYLHLAQRYSVALFSNQIDDLQENGAIYELAPETKFCLRSQFYQDDIGVVLPGIIREP